MTIKDYLVVENNVVTNVVAWDGDTNTWQPPEGATMLVQDTTPARLWVLNEPQNDYVLAEIVGAGTIGFVWDGQILATTESKPELPPLTALDSILPEGETS